ncbi:hypothetical protein B0J13DRAFT_617623 [Dactylonectria estremocensis]|uniref:Uncharacterized protein n=1 Tax=Dactylonectria estremocensis TaxID=1079267 RepID=A0A9P9FBL7_9HYPO|nr:hypothetical protein B0J13DRAFT_617623 [Dactylonectria estremocensis]
MGGKESLNTSTSPRLPKRSWDENEEAVDTNTTTKGPCTPPSKRCRLGSGDQDDDDVVDAIKDAVEHTVENSTGTASTHFTNNPSHGEIIFDDISDDGDTSDEDDLWDVEVDLGDLESFSDDEIDNVDDSFVPINWSDVLGAIVDAFADAAEDSAGTIFDDDSDGAYTSDEDRSDIEVGLDDLDRIHDVEVEGLYQSLRPVSFLDSVGAAQDDIEDSTDTGPTHFANDPSITEIVFEGADHFAGADISNDDDLQDVEVSLDDLESIQDDEIESLYRSLSPIDFMDDFLSNSISMVTTLMGPIDEEEDWDLIGEEVPGLHADEEILWATPLWYTPPPHLGLPSGATLSGREYLRFVMGDGQISDDES